MINILIDTDGLLYTSSLDNFEDSIESIKERINIIFTETGASNYLLAFSSKPYFRSRINSDYKSNRKPTQLKYIRVLQEFLKSEYNYIMIPGLEADDILSIAKNIDETIIISSPDKDVLCQVPGRHFDYSFKKINEEFYEPRRWVETSEEQAERFLWKQVLMGDSADGIPGLYNVGNKKSNVILDNKRDNQTYEELVIKTYVEHYDNVSLALKNLYKTFFQVYLLRNTDECFDFNGCHFPSLEFKAIENKTSDDTEIF